MAFLISKCLCVVRRGKMLELRIDRCITENCDWLTCPSNSSFDFVGMELLSHKQWQQVTNMCAVTEVRSLWLMELGRCAGETIITVKTWTVYYIKIPPFRLWKFPYPPLWNSLSPISVVNPLVYQQTMTAAREHVGFSSFSRFASGALLSFLFYLVEVVWK